MSIQVVQTGQVAEVTVVASRGPAGATGAPGPNTITTATESNLTGFISANGTNVSGATTGTTAATPSTVVLRDATGGTAFAGIVTAPRITGRCDGLEVLCKAGLAINAGQVVYVTGASGNNIIIGLAQANAEPTSSKTIGISESTLANNGTGYAITEGLMTVSISAPAAVEGDPIWLSPSTAGGMVFGVANKPFAPNHIVYLGVVTRKTGNTVVEIYVKIQNGAELDELADVLISSPVEGQALMRGATLWENRSLAAADISDLGTAAYADTGTAEGQVAIFGEQGSFSTNGNNATISTTGSDAYIFTSGEGASIFTSGTSAFILTSDTFKLFNGANTTTLDHSATAEQTIILPDASGTIALTSDITGTNSGTNTGDETGARIASIITAATSKTTPVDADEIPITDSAASFGLKKLTFANLKTALNTLYVALTGNQTIAGDKTFSGQTELTGQAATNSTSAMTRDLVRGDVGVLEYRTSSFAGTGASTAISGSGNMSGGPTIASSSPQCGATTGGYALQRHGSFLNMSEGVARGTVNFAKKFHMKISSISIFTGTLNEARWQWPVPSTQTTGALPQGGFGFKMVGSKLYGIAHNGTSESATTSFASPSNVHRFFMEVKTNGVGTAEFFVNGSSLGTLSIPTSTVVISGGNPVAINVTEAFENSENMYAIVHDWKIKSW